MAMAPGVTVTNGARRFPPPGTADSAHSDVFDPQEGAAHLRRTHVKEPTREERQLRCFRKRRYRSQGDALDAAAVAGVERQRKAYQCPYCRLWHLTTVEGGLDPGS